MTRISVIAAAIFSSVLLIGCSSGMSDSDRAIAEQAQRDAASAKASAAAARQSADAARSSEVAVRQSVSQTAAMPTQSTQFRNAQRK